MNNPCNESCIQKTKIALLTKDKDNMANDINDIKVDVSDIKKDMNLIKEFILTSPQKFADKEKTEDFINGINAKIAWVSGIFFTISTIAGFFLNKYF